MAAHNVDSALGDPEVLGDEFHDGLVRLSVDGTLLDVHRQCVVFGGSALFHERAFAAARFDANDELHVLRLTRRTKTGRQ